MILDVVIAVVDGITGLVLLGGGVLGFRLVRRARRDARAEGRRRAARALHDQALIEQHQELDRRRAVRTRAAKAWQADFDALLPPAPACTSSEHNHVENYRIGSQRVERICVVRPPYSVGGITAQEAVQALQRMGPQWLGVLSPGAQEARLRMLEAYRRKDEPAMSADEVESMRRQAEARARRGF